MTPQSQSNATFMAAALVESLDVLLTPGGGWEWHGRVGAKVASRVAGSREEAWEQGAAWITLARKEEAMFG